MVKISRNEADYVREVLNKPNMVKHTIGKGKKKTYYCVEDPYVMRKLRELYEKKEK